MSSATKQARVAAIDCGTNSLRLLIAQEGSGGGLVDLERRLEIVRLGQGVDATGEFHPAALARTFAAVDRYAHVIKAAGVPARSIRFVATSAARDVGNRQQFFDGIQQRLGISPDVVTGDSEAELSFIGVLSRIRPSAEPVLVMDIGGGSTELILGSADGQIFRAVSLDIGSVRLTERFLPGSPPTVSDLDQAARYVDLLLQRAGLDFSAVGTWVGVAGTVTTLAALHLQLDSYDTERVHGCRIPRGELARLLARLGSLSADQIRALPAMHPQRADVITAGTLIAARVADVVAVPELLVSESDILDGIALQLLRQDRRIR